MLGLSQEAEEFFHDREVPLPRGTPVATSDSPLFRPVIGEGTEVAPTAPPSSSPPRMPSCSGTTTAAADNRNGGLPSSTQSNGAQHQEQRRGLASTSAFQRWPSSPPRQGRNPPEKEDDGSTMANATRYNTAAAAAASPARPPVTQYKNVHENDQADNCTAATTMAAPLASGAFALSQPQGYQHFWQQPSVIPPPVGLDGDEGIGYRERMGQSVVRSRPKKALGMFTRVLCCTVSYQWWHTLLIAVPVLATGLIFLVSVVPRGEVYSYVVGGVLVLLSLACLFLCVLVDPGIVPPAPADQARAVPEFVEIKGVSVECRPCHTCHVIRPPRSTHCQFCDVCVEEFDHHCQVLGVCVAKRTYRFFGGFFIVTTVLCFYIFIRSVILLYQVRATFNETAGSRWQFAAGIICVLVSVLGGCFVVPFAGMYVFMACLATTQKEMMRAGQMQRPGTHFASHLGGANAGSAEGVSRGSCSPNMPYATNPCWDCLTRFLGPLGHSRISKDYFV